MVALRRLLRLPAFAGATVAAGRCGLDVPVTLVTVGEVPDGAGFLCGGELVLTTFFAQRDDVPAALDAYRAAGAAAVAWKRSDWLGGLPDAARAFSDAAGFPLIEVPRDRRWPQLIEASLGLLRGRRVVRGRLRRRRLGPAPAAAPFLGALYAAPGLSAAGERLLAPLLAYDRTHRAALAPTLLAFLDHRQNACATATALFLHRNSLAYRLRRIRRLTGLDFHDARACLAWHLALAQRLPAG